MKNKELTKNILKGVAAVVLVTLTAYMFPRYQHSFAYRYEVGKPWRYDRLVADFDFPVYKSQEQLNREQEEVLREVEPCFMFVENRPHSPLVMSAQERDRLQEEGIEYVAVVTGQVSQTYSLRQILTPKAAYVALGEEVEINLIPDTATTNQLRQDVIRNISLTRGVVQTGEKIIDKGDIVDEHVANILNSLQLAYEKNHSTKRLSTWSITGEVAVVMLCLLMFGLYLFVFRKQLWDDTKSIIFFCLLSTILIVLTCLLLRYTSLSIYLIPFAWIPVLVRSFYDARTALVLHITTILILSLAVPDSFEFVLIQIMVGMVAVSSLKEMTQRAQLAHTSGWIFVAYVVIYTAFVLGTTGSLHNINPWNYLYFAINAVLIIGSYGLIYLFERLFHLLSPITLVELTDINSSLLLEFAEKAPGSFQHSMQVSTLAMEAAKRIGAKSLLVRTGALYHDIGKMNNAAYFTENQQDGVNPLLDMTPQEAAKVVMAHVTDGVIIANAHHLPQVIVNFIQTHHGTSLTRYFYNTAVNNGGKVNEADFRYSGIKPTTREAAILMMADAVEARSRSLKDYTEESVNAMVDDMIDMQIREGQFSETPLSFRDMETIRKVFKERLLAMNHHRVKYPTIQDSNQ